MSSLTLTIVSQNDERLFSTSINQHCENQCFSNSVRISNVVLNLCRDNFSRVHKSTTQLQEEIFENHESLKSSIHSTKSETCVRNDTNDSTLKLLEKLNIVRSFIKVNNHSRYVLERALKRSIRVKSYKR